MNKYQEAKETIMSNYPPENYTMLREALDLAMSLLDKETPTKTIKSHCGKCNIGYLVKSRGDKYCHVCGYKIDWGNDNE